MLRLKNVCATHWLLLLLPFFFQSCTSTNRSYSRDYTVNRSTRSSNYNSTSPRTTERAKPRHRPSNSATPSNSRSNNKVANTTTKNNRSTNRTSANLREELVQRNRLVDFASQFEGKPYVYGGKTPESGFDCSGLMYYTFRHFDYSINASSRAQAQQGRKIKLTDAAPGDLLFFGQSGKVNHVAMVVHNTSKSLIILHSTSSGGVIKEDYYQSSYWQRRYLFAKSYVGVLNGGSMANR